jgi:hypothetical protein
VPSAFWGESAPNAAEQLTQMGCHERRIVTHEEERGSVRLDFPVIFAGSIHDSGKTEIGHDVLPKTDKNNFYLLIVRPAAAYANGSLESTSIW